MHFLTQPKINRVADYLESKLAEVTQRRWTNYISIALRYGALVDYKAHLSGEVRSEQIYQRNCCRGKNHFNWVLFPNPADSKPYFLVKNARLQYFHYSELLKKARAVKKILIQKNPDYDTVINLANEIKNQTAIVPSVITGHDVRLNVGWSLGGNLVIDFFAGICGLIHAPLMAAASILFSPAYALSYSDYLGSFTFLLDAAVYFFESAYQIISSVMFPISMLYSKYSTDSFDVFTKGSVERSLEGIISLALAEKELIKSQASEAILAVC